MVAMQSERVELVFDLDHVQSCQRVPEALCEELAAVDDHSISGPRAQQRAFLQLCLINDEGVCVARMCSACWARRG